jgi:hypothetical protein
VTVFVTGADACPAVGTADAVDFCAVAELPLPPEELPLPPEEPVPDEPLLDPPGRIELTGEAADVTGLAAALTADPTDERAEDGADPRGECVSSVDACACLENSIMMTKIPAATIASCIARMATRRAIGCGMSTPTRQEPEGIGTCCPFSAGLCHAPEADLDLKVMTCCAATNVQRFRLVRQEGWKKRRAR